MEQDGLYNWLESTFASLPRITEEGYKAIWQKGALRFSKQDRVPDLIDELNARLVCAALSERQQLLIVLPDRLPHRGALLFATALLLESVDRVRSHTRGGKVLYFSSTIGIREHLSQLYVNNLCLASVFPQTRLQRNLSIVNMPLGGSSGKRQSSSPIPFSLSTVLCIYSPGDPIAICQQHKGIWFAVDCADDRKLSWLRPLVEEAKRRNISLIAWAQNPLATVIEDFRVAGGQIFTWPATDTQLPPIDTPVAKGLHKVFDNAPQHLIHPIVIENPASKVGIEHLQQGYFELSKTACIASSGKASHLALGTIQISWRYLRALENLCVPFDLFEAEIENFWGISSLRKTREALNKYVGTLAEWDYGFYSQLIEVQRHLQEVHSQFEKQGPPLWTMLSNLCVENVASGTARLFVFPTSSGKKLFSLALLAYYNITEDDLKQLHIGLTSLHELYDLLTLPPQEDVVNVQTLHLLAGLPTTDLQWEYCVVGLPSYTSTPYLDPMLRQNSFQFILYPYQLATLARRIRHWETAVYPSIVDCIAATAAVTKHEHPLINPFSTRPRLAMQSPQKYTVEMLGKQAPTQVEKTGFWEAYDPLEEIAALMHADIEDDALTIFSKSISRTSGAASGSLIEFVDEIRRIEFNTGEYVLLDTDEKVNVVISTNGGLKTDERFVSSLRPGDRIVFIHGQRKQSLLDLMISRVHRNPVINLHVKLVEKWQEDFAAAYQSRKPNMQKLDLNGLFFEMKVRGSSISDPQTLRNWLHGETLRPQDQEDLRRIAEILDLEFVRQHYRRIHQAGSRLAGLHIKLSRRLNAWLSHEAPDIVVNAANQDDVIDEQLGLTFQDFRDSLSILQVKAVHKEKGLFAKDTLGQLEREKSS